MALVRPLTVNGTEYPLAYSRITYIRADKATAYIFVCTYADETARFSDELPVQQEEHSIALSSLAGGDLFPEAYEYIKTLPGFESAVDHLAAATAEELATPAQA